MQRSQIHRDGRGLDSDHKLDPRLPPFKNFNARDLEIRPLLKIIKRTVKTQDQWHQTYHTLLHFEL